MKITKVKNPPKLTVEEQFRQALHDVDEIIIPEDVANDLKRWGIDPNELVSLLLNKAKVIH